MKNFVAILITFVPFLLVYVYIIYSVEPNSGINWMHSLISAVVLGLSYSIANRYRKSGKK
jgi:hypothetical protein